jgi:hypothetical protein
MDISSLLNEVPDPSSELDLTATYVENVDLLKKRPDGKRCDLFSKLLKHYHPILSN